MRKINLEALESKNMTVAAEDTLSEINGGCKFRIARCNNCGKLSSYYVLDAKDPCGNHCKGAAARYVAYRTGYTGWFEVWNCAGDIWGVQHEDWGSAVTVSDCWDGKWKYFSY